MHNQKLERSLNAIARQQGFSFTTPSGTGLEPHFERVQPSSQAESLETAAAKLGERLRAEVGLFDLYSFRRDKRERLEALHDLLLCVALSKASSHSKAALPVVTLNYYGELLAAVSGLSRPTLYDYLNILASAGLLVYKGRVVSIELDGKQVNRCDGSVMCVTLDGSIRPKITKHDFETVRDLAADIKAGRTVWAFLKRSKKLLQSPKDLSKQEKIKLLSTPSLPPAIAEKPSLEVTVKVSRDDALNALRALPGAIKEDRAEDVDEAARWLAAKLGDSHSLNLWRRVCWQLLRAEDAGLNPRSIGGKCLFEQVASLLERVLIDKEEGVTRNVGAYALARLKTWDWWDEVMRVPPVRVARKAVSHTFS